MNFPLTAKIKDRQEAAEGTLTVTLDLDSQKAQFIPGQYFFVQLPKLLYPDDRGKQRHFSINNTPNQSNMLVFTTRLRDTGYKKTIKELPLGTEVKIPAISGSFVLPEETSQPLVFIAGGIGITPFISMIRWVKEENLPYKITLLYSNKDKKGAAFFDELSKLDQEMENLKVVFSMTRDENWQGEKRRIDAQFIKDKVENIDDSVFYVVGPPEMVTATQEEVRKAGIPDERVKTEKFTGY